MRSPARTLTAALLVAGVCLVIAALARRDARDTQALAPTKTNAPARTELAAELDPARDGDIARAQLAHTIAQGADDALLQYGPDEREHPQGPCDGLWVRVVDAEGAAQAGARLVVIQDVRRTRQLASSTRRVEDHVRTDAEGRARISAHAAEEIRTIQLTTRAGKRLKCFVGFITWPGAPDEVRVVLPAPARVHGHVRDTNGAPLAGFPIERCTWDTQARVFGEHILSPEECVQCATDANGAYAADLFTGWIVVGLEDARRPRDNVRFELDAEHREREVDFVVPALDRRVRIVLDVAPEIDDPFTGLVLIAGRRAEGPERERTTGGVVYEHDTVSARAERADDGTWSVAIGRSGAWTLHARGPRVRKVDVDIPVDADEVRLALLPPPDPEDGRVRLAGHVVDENGAAIPDAVVSYASANTGGSSGGSRDRSGGSFALAIPRPPPEFVYLTGRCPGYGTASIGPIASTQSREGLVIVLAPSLSIRGRVTGLTPPSLADLVLTSRGNRLTAADAVVNEQEMTLHPPSERGATNQRGEFEFKDIAAGEYDLWVAPRNLELPPARARVRAGETCVIELGSGLEGELAIDCKVVDALTGAPIEGASVSLEPQHAARGARARTGADGRCRLRGHAPGTWQLRAAAAGYALSQRRPESLTESCARVIELAPACTLDLAFTDSLGPVGDVTLALTSPDGELLEFGTSALPCADAAGRVMLTWVPAGRVRVVIAWRAGELIAFEDGDFALANPRGLPVFELDARPGVREIVRRVLR